MATPHISAEKGEIAPVVLMPGDPLRARFIADSFLDHAIQFNSVRGMLGYTGLYQGRPVSVMGSGMGMPSIGIYSYELFTEYGVESIVRVGTAGSYSPEIKLFDLLLVNGAYSESTYALTMNGQPSNIARPSEILNEKLRVSARRAKKSIREGMVHCSDVFYRQQQGEKIPYWQVLRDEKGCVAVEMESFALFHNAAVTKKMAACLLTISDSFITPEKATSQQREKFFTDMIEVALGILSQSESAGL